jgi:hypothetical protein
VPLEEQLALAAQGVAPPVRPTLPSTHAGWAHFEFSDDAWERLRADVSVLALSRESLPGDRLTQMTDDTGGASS